MRPKSLAGSLFLLLAGAASAQTVHVVDGANGPGAHFTTLFGAVNAAEDGDVILMRAGSYFEDVFVDGSSLYLQAEAGATVGVGKVLVQNLGPDDTFGMRGIDLLGGGASGTAAVRAVDCAGSLWFEDMTVHGDPIAFTAGGGWFTNCAEVVFTRCVFEPPFNLVLPTISIDGSSVSLFDTLVDGLDGSGQVFITTPGEDAVEMIDGELFLYGSTINGGDGGNGIGVCGPGSPGGDGVVLGGQNPVVHVLDSTVTAGKGGLGSGDCPDGADGATYRMNAPAGSVLPVNGVERNFVVGSPVREGETMTLTFTGQPGDRVWLKYPRSPGPAILSSFWDGPLVTQTRPARSMGTIPASGVLTRNFTVPELPATAEALTFFAQAFFLDQRFIVSTPSFLVALDGAF